MARTKEFSAPRTRFRQGAKTRRCNLCAEEFPVRSVFDRYCQKCREQNELFKFSDWLPELNEQLVGRLT
ncbi:MAG TPA: hypothetical protein DCS07_04075 [Bdellovibrionales bacterium]|nr:MAG: hypothetical protein A2X97_16475 [Bdellovibrionales bacterium GWA1_52_35]HAR41795.1 hypothetical protein [Bdellovibrionales bacterium]HCM39018.1 hypothetical protein [Bdellovibrionales bacterium]